MLIPARNEEANIAAALRSVLPSENVDLEVIVLDDGSTDRTAEIVREFAAADPRVRLETAQPLPAGWCGKNFACHQLAAPRAASAPRFHGRRRARLATDSLARLAEFVEQSGAALVSGVPREETHGLTEKLIIPLIHFVLLGFLPLRADARIHRPALRRRLRTNPRRPPRRLPSAPAATPPSPTASTTPSRSRAVFRAHGFATDLFDATDTFHCRMYQRAAEVWHGFAKNAHEGLGSPALIVPSTLLLLGGQVLPLILLAVAPSRTRRSSAPSPPSSRASSPSPASASRLLGALLHPVGICALVAIQWFAFIRSLRQRPAVWKGRCLLTRPRDMKLLLLALILLHAVALAAPVEKLSDFELTDQDAKTRSYRFPKAKVTVMTVADHKGSDQLAPWIQALHDRYAKAHRHRRRRRRLDDPEALSRHVPRGLPQNSSPTP